MSSPTCPDSGHYHELQSPISMAPPSSSPIRGPGLYDVDAHFVVDNRKERRKTSITPRKFTRFFTPRSLLSTSLGSTRRSLFETSPNANAGLASVSRSSPIRPKNDMSPGQENSPPPFTRDLKRRKLIHEPELNDCSEKSTITCMLDPICSIERSSNQDPFTTTRNSTKNLERLTVAQSSALSASSPIRLPEKSIQRVQDKGISGRLLQLNLGGNPRATRQRHVYPVDDYQEDTANFYGRPEDVHACNIQRPRLEPCIPFCTATCNTNTLVALGDERGKVRLLESSKSGKPDFNDVYLSFQAHANAIIDMSFSEDDSLLATGSGDQRVKVIDMQTQQSICDLEDKHFASVKAVKFQSGSANNHVLATCSRDGNVHIYDTRCRGIPQILINARPGEFDSPYTDPTNMTRIRCINSLMDAHRPVHPGRNLDTEMLEMSKRHTLPRSNPYAEAVSVTSIMWMPAGQEHLLLTASELDSSVKLWDIRSIPRKTEIANPLSSTACPQSHNTYRQAGLTSLALSGDGTRLYAAARDSAVYVYSTPHLMLGQAAEMVVTNKPRRSLHTQTQTAMGPLYAYRHPMLLIGSFYIKCAIRPARNGKPEMLAVGSTDSCPILFPTDERHLETAPALNSRHYAASSIGGRNDLHNTSTSSPRSRRRRHERAQTREAGILRVSERGTALVEGHTREVSSVAWNYDGDLVAVSDDSVVRVWREGINGEARNLRVGGNEDGRRWGCGWADVGPEFDSRGGDVDMKDDCDEHF